MICIERLVISILPIGVFFCFQKIVCLNRTIIYLKNIFDFSDQKIEMDLKYFFNIIYICLYSMFILNFC